MTAHVDPGHDTDPVPFSLNPVVPHLTGFLNLISGLRLRYYNGLALYRRRDLLVIPRWSRSFAFQGEVLMHMILRGATYDFVPVRVRGTREKQSKAFRLKNMLGVVATFTRLFWSVRVLRRHRSRGARREGQPGAGGASDA